MAVALQKNQIICLPANLLNETQKNSPLSGITQIAVGCIALVGTCFYNDSSNKKVNIQILMTFLVGNGIRTLVFPRQFKAVVYFPKMEEIETISLEKIHAIWKSNNETLIGILKCCDVPLMGFHGTSKEGLEGISRIKTSKEYIWVAGVDCYLDPITTLADLYTIIQKASYYMDDSSGGLLIVETKTARLYQKYICTERAYRYLTLAFDSASDKHFLDLVYRNTRDDKAGFQEVVYNTYRKGEMSSTSRIHVADELHLSFNPENYDSIVKGVIPSGTALYPKERVKKLQTEKQWQRFVLAQRLQMQEIVVKAFQALGVVKSWQADQLIKFQIAGKDLLSKAGEVTLVKIDALSKHVASTTPFKISD